MQVSTQTMRKPPVYRPRDGAAFRLMLDEYRRCYAWDDAVAAFEDFVAKGAVHSDALVALRCVSQERGWSRPVSLDD